MTYMEEAIVKIRNLSHRYSVQWAIRDITFDVKKNGIQALLGSNGAGKSTLMKIMCGVLRQTEGDVFINDMNTKDKPVEAKRFIGFLPQHPPLRLDLTVEEYLTYSAYLRWIPSKEVKQAVEEVMGKCKIAHFRHRVLRALSGGYQQRVGIAQAIIHKPVLVVLDEPTNGLDPNQILEIRHLIKEIAEERTVILSTHMLSEVQAICDHIRMIEQGQLVFSGTMEEFDNYIVPNTLLVTLKQPPLLDELLHLEGVVNAEALGENRFRLGFRDVSGVVENLVETSVARKWQLVEVGVEKKSLEAIFAELSKKK